MKRLFWLAITFLLLPACRQASEGRSRVEVSTDPAEIAAARALYRDRRAARLSELLNEPEGIRSFDREALDIVRENRPLSLAALRKAADDVRATASRRLGALLALQLLEEPVPPGRLAALACHDTDAAIELSSRFWDLYPDDSPLPGELRSCVVGWIASADRRVRIAALRLVAFRDIPEAAGPVFARLDGAGEKDDELFPAAARLRPTGELLARLEKRLKPAEPIGGHSGLDAICTLGKATRDPAVRLRAAHVVARYLVQQEDVAWVDGTAMSALELLGTMEPASLARDLLAEVVTSARWKALREYALQRMAETDSPAAADLARRTGLPVPARQQPPEPARSLEECARILVDESVLTREEADAALAKPRSAPTDGESRAPGPETVLQAADRFLAFDVETDMFPNRHDLLIADFGRASAGRFRPEAAIETCTEGKTESDPVSCEVQFVHVGRLYRFRPSDLGDWYDLDVVIEAVHRALSDAGVRERFEMIATGDQTAMLVFGNPAALRKAAGKLGLALEANLDRPHSSGKAFEEKVKGAVGR